MEIQCAGQSSQILISGQVITCVRLLMSMNMYHYSTTNNTLHDLKFDICVHLCVGDFESPLRLPQLACSVQWKGDQSQHVHNCNPPQIFPQPAHSCDKGFKLCLLPFTTLGHFGLNSRENQHFVRNFVLTFEFRFQAPTYNVFLDEFLSCRNLVFLLHHHLKRR